MGTVEKLTLENMGVAFGILSLGGTETEIHLGGHLQRTFKKNTIATLGLVEKSLRCNICGPPSPTGNSAYGEPITGVRRAKPS